MIGKIKEKFILEVLKNTWRASHQSQPAQLYAGKVLLVEPDFLLWLGNPLADQGNSVDVIYLDVSKAFKYYL